ncbi:hypothetical protein [Parvibaculum sp.]|uniref:hypothetical protein n=1 Tax=Parvibaculum sp. TaxID=2024848 RepID=UPI00391C216A
MGETISPEGSTSREAPEPGQPLDEAKLRKLKLLMGMMSGFLVLTFMVVIAAFVWRLSGGGAEGGAPRASLPAGYFGISHVGIAPGQMVRSVTLGEGRVAIHVTGGDADMVILADPKSGAELGRIVVTPMSDFAAR